ncbi:hypothetical protein [Bacillus toyonensis]|nr:hypothetical protein [Bacillus toyonensis]
MGQQKCTELMYDDVKQQGEVYVIDPEGTFTEGLKRLQEILAQKKQWNKKIHRNYARESMVEEKRTLYEPVVCEDLS